jgi:hypothetical protein
MICYGYSEFTFEYTTSGEAYESPLEPGVFLLPAHATFIEPPPFDPATQICKFNEATQEWELSERPVDPE